MRRSQRTRRRSLTVLVCLLTLLAGCSGVPGLGGGGDDAYGDGESLNTTALADDHASNLREAGSFTVTQSANSSLGADGDGTTAEQDQRVAVDLEANRTLLEGASSQSMGGQSASTNQTLYATDGATYLRLQRGNETQYQRFDANDSGPMTPSLDGEQFVALDSAVPLVGATEWTRDGTTTRDGETLTRFTASGNDSLDLSSLGAGAQATNVTEYDAELLVTSDGTVREMSSTVGLESRGQTLSQTVVVRFTDVGETTVEEPDWLDEADNASDPAGTAAAPANATTATA